MTHQVYESVKRQLRRRPRTWLVTGCAGFIGSHLVENLLLLNQRVIGLDNFATGSRKNLTSVRQKVGAGTWKRFRFLPGDITRLADCYRAVGIRLSQGKRGQRSPVDIILHQAGLGSVPRSVADPLRTHHANVTGTLNLLVAARDAGVRRVVYAASSSTYGDSPRLPKREEIIGRPLSPYAVSKYADELYAGVFGRCYGLETLGLRYFNVFGPRQDPEGAYAAVIPRWIGEALRNQRNVIHGDGRTSRDFCFVDNVVQANLLAATTSNPKAWNEVYNVACGEQTPLAELHKKIHQFLRVHLPNWRMPQPMYRAFREGDVRHSLASIAKARRLLGYRPAVKIGRGLDVTVQSFIRRER